MRAVVSLEQADDSLRLPRGHIVVGDDLTALQMSLSVDDKCAAATIQNLPTNEIGRDSCPETLSSGCGPAREVMLSQSIGGSPAMTRSLLVSSADALTVRTARISSSAWTPRLFGDGVVFPGFSQDRSSRPRRRGRIGQSRPDTARSPSR